MAGFIPLLQGMSRVPVSVCRLITFLHEKQKNFKYFKSQILILSNFYLTICVKKVGKSTMIHCGQTIFSQRKVYSLLYYSKYCACVHMIQCILVN